MLSVSPMWPDNHSVALVTEVDELLRRANMAQVLRRNLEADVAWDRYQAQAAHRAWANGHMRTSDYAGMMLDIAQCLARRTDQLARMLSVLENGICAGTWRGLPS